MGAMSSVVDFKDYYTTLGVSKTATDKEIKQAFRKLARKYHPDVNPGDKGAEARFKEVNEANEVLSDPQKERRRDGGDVRRWWRRQPVLRLLQDVLRRHGSRGIDRRARRPRQAAGP